MNHFRLLEGNLWYRQGLTPSYPQGSAWELNSNNVTKVSVGPLDQVSVCQVDSKSGQEIDLPTTSGNYCEI